MSDAKPNKPKSTSTSRPKAKKQPAEEQALTTGPLSREQQTHLSQAIREPTAYIPVPEVLTGEDGTPLPYWRVRLIIDADPPEAFGFDLYGPLTIGRGPEKGTSFLDLTVYEAAGRGVSRHHLELRPTPHGLFASDLGSTNGTYRNGILMRPHSPTPLGSHDTLSLSLLHITVDIVDAPHQEAEWVARQATLGKALTEMAKTITTQLKVQDVLNTVVDYAINLTHAQEATLWLLETNMRELRLEAARGLEEELVKQATLPITGSVAGDAVLTGKPQLRTRDEMGTKVAITKDYFVDSVLSVPLALGGLSLGVLSVSNRTMGHEFTENDLSLLVSLADFAAIALQNSRTLEATDEALRESLRAQRESTARALESTRLKTEFLATVSHELRSPLHTINGFSQIILRGSFGELTSGLRDAVERIQSSGRQLLQMVDDLLDSLRIESQEMELAHEEFSPRKLISDVVAAHMPIAKDKGLILAWNSDPDVPDLMAGDPGRIGQVITNLVTNALKFTDKGGISIQIRMVGTFMWAVAVADTGQGIPAESLELIFERFRQVDQSSTRAHGGVGLGLAISSDLVKLMGGDLRVTSEGIPGKGSIFTMTLPLVLPGQEWSVVGEDDTIITLKLGSKATTRSSSSAAKPAPPPAE